MSSARATYVYCLVRSGGVPEVDEAPDGLPGLSSPRILDVDDGLWLVAADAPLPAYGAEEIEEKLDDLAWVSERALAHERVVEHFLDADALVPFKLFTLFSGDDRAVADVRGRSDRLGAVLERVGGCREWGVRARFRGPRDDQEASESAGDEGEERPASGTEFLRRKKERRDAGRSASRKAREGLEQAFRELSEAAADARRLPIPAADGPAPVLLDAVFLVPEQDREGFERAVDRVGSSLAERHVDITLTGPWPPYNFVGVDEDGEPGLDRQATAGR